MKNFEFTGATREFYGRTCYQIRATRDINDDVKAGDLGGWLESETSLKGGWIHQGGRVMKEATVYNGSIHGCAIVYGGTIYGGDIYDGTVYGGTVYGGVVYGGKIYGGSVYGGKISGGEVRGGEVYDGEVLIAGSVRRGA